MDLFFSEVGCLGAGSPRCHQNTPDRFIFVLQVFNFVFSEETGIAGEARLIRFARQCRTEVEKGDVVVPEGALELEEGSQRIGLSPRMRR